MSIHEFQNRLHKDETNDLMQALQEVTHLDSESVENAGWGAWRPED